MRISQRWSTIIFIIIVILALIASFVVTYLDTPPPKHQRNKNFELKPDPL